MTDNLRVLACPFCGRPLAAGAARLECDGGHHFDRAREGYVNLLTPKETRGREHGDDRDMVAARRRFLDAGHYDFLADALGEVVSAVAPPAAPSTALDIGCGEGRFTRGLPVPERVGLDVSRAAIRLAAKRDRATTYVVANAASPPVLTASVDVVVVVMGPVFPDAVARVLSPSGVAVVVVPGAPHLESVRRLLYEEYREHDETLLLARDERFEVLSNRRVEAELHLTADAVADLLLMTPYRWATPAAARDRALAAGALTTLASFVICTARVRT